MKRFFKLRVHPEGYRFIFLALVASGLLLAFAWQWTWIGLMVCAWCVYFFRDPTRTIPEGEGLVVAPADGVLVRVGEAVPPAEIGLPDQPHIYMAIFMNVFDCHVNRAPLGGNVKKLAYRRGKFFNAELDKASEHNERQAFLLEADDAARTQIGVVQIAGLIARRIVRFVEEKQEVRRGMRLGLIRFGSRVDVYLPLATDVLVGLGQRAIAGETVLAKLNNGNNKKGKIRGVRQE